MNKKDNKKGYSVIIVILILLVLILVVSGASYYLLKSTGQAPQLPSPYSSTQDTPAEAETEPAPLTDSDDLDTLEEEINNTLIGSPDDDIDSMESDASSL